MTYQSLSLDFFSVTEFYTPGQTGTHLTEIFMKASNLFGKFDHDMSAAYQYLMDLFQKSGEFAGAGFLLTAPSAKSEFQFIKAVGHESPQMRNTQINVKNSALGHCAETCIPIHLKDLKQDSKFRQDILLSLVPQICSLISVPIIHEQTLYGLMFAYNRSGMREFANGELNVLAYLGIVAGEYMNDQIHSKAFS